MLKTRHFRELEVFLILGIFMGSVSWIRRIENIEVAEVGLFISIISTKTLAIITKFYENTLTKEDYLCIVQ